MQRCKSLLRLPLKTVNNTTAQISRNFFTRRRSHLPTIISNRPLNVFSDFENEIQSLSRNFERLERDLFRSPLFFEPLSIGLQQLGKNTEFAPMRIFESEHDGKYKLSVGLGENFKPENIKVSLKDRVLSLDAKIEQSSEDGTSRIYQEFSRQMTLPQNLELGELKSVFTPEGILEIEGPLKESEKVEKKEIPISIENKG